jgi:hypothetical protein
MKKLLFFFICLSSLAKAQFIVNSNGIDITNSAVLLTNGDWQNNGSFRNDGVIYTTQSWVNTGTMNNVSTGGFVLNYSENASFSAGSNSARIGFILKQGNGIAVVAGSVLVKDSLKISAGTIRVNSNTDSLAFTGNTLMNVAAGSYVEGPMARVGVGTFTFPVGLEGNYLPITFYNSTSARVGVTVDYAPAGYTAGEVVSSLIDFPYVWRTTKALAADTARYIEVQAPDYLLGFDNIIVARKAGENQYEGMGSRLISSDGTNTTVRSYSRALRGMFTLAIGYNGNMVTDSTELVNLFTATNGNNWSSRTNWRVGEVPAWFGVTEKGGRVTGINLPNNNVVGEVPETITNMAALKAVNLSSNGVTSIPDLTVMPAITAVDVSSNNLDFASLESNASLIGSVIYENQAPVSLSNYNEIPVNSDTTLVIPVGGNTNQYQWKFKGEPISGANSDTYTVTSINRSKMGDYVLEITNPQVPGLVLTSGIHSIAATATISGTLFANSTTPAQSGKMRLLRVTAVGAYDTLQVKDVSPTVPVGKYSFTDVVLDDYLVNGFPDTLITAYKKAIPTWYTQSIYWEEADILELEDNVADLDIVAQTKPEPPTAGQGIITGTFYENTAEGGRVSARARVASAAVSVRRVERAGRGKEEILTLVAYLFTDDNGEFSFSRLDAGEYRINLQYPGYPMDEESYITIPIVDNLFERQVGVEAEVIDGKIFVRKLIITGWEEESPSMTAYPNPTVEYLYITGKSNVAVRFKMTDSNGRAMGVQARWDAGMKQWELDVRTLTPGVYILDVMQQGKVEKLRIIVQ